MERVDPKTVSRRASKLSSLVRKLSLEKNEEWIDWEGNIIIYKRGRATNQWFGRNFAYKPFLVELKGNNLGKKIFVRAIEAKRSFIVSKAV